MCSHKSRWIHEWSDSMIPYLEKITDDKTSQLRYLATKKLLVSLYEQNKIMICPLLLIYCDIQSHELKAQRKSTSGLTAESILWQPSLLLLHYRWLKQSITQTCSFSTSTTLYWLGQATFLGSCLGHSMWAVINRPGAWPALLRATRRKRLPITSRPMVC